MQRISISPKVITEIQIKSLFSVLFLAFICYSCSDVSNVKPKHFYFGGEIINPNSNYVTLYNENGVSDTIYLDDKNRFLKKYDSIAEGLYLFFHSPEGQVVLLEKGDSILARVNMVEFDESLVFSGKGAKKNNFLIDMFLLNEKERKENTFDFGLSPRDFLEKIDNAEKKRFADFEKFKNKVELSNLGEKILTSSFVSHFRTQKETYPLEHFGNNLSYAQKKFKEIPPAFFDYRKDLNLNDTNIKISLNYNRFLTRYIDNKAYMDFALENNYREEEPNATIRKLEFIDSVFTEEYIKNFQLRGITRQFINFNEDSASSNKVLKNFLAISTNQQDKETMNRLVGNTKKLAPGNIIPDQKLISSDSTMVRLTNLAKKNKLTAIYFWSVLDIQYYRKAHTKVAQLREKYPDVQFISINIDEDKTKKWINVLDKYEYLRDFEYQFDDVGKSRNELVLYQYTRDKTILLGRNGKILNPNANIFDPLFESKLDIYSKQQVYDKKFIK